MENASETTISTTFFENLWPLILDENRCDIKTEDVQYFVPQRKFDNLWAHEFLAEKNFDNYKPAIELNCCQLNEDVSEDAPKSSNEEELMQLPYRQAYIMPLEQQLANLQKDVEVREKLAKDFANHTYPWYIQRPSYEYSFTITDELRQLFKNPFEFEILRQIQVFDCSLMLIDVASAVPLKNLECWQKFSPYVALVFVVHDEHLHRELKNFNRIFNTVFIEEDTENTWQDELNRSLEVGLQLAKKLYFFDDASKPFVFVFSNNRGICVLDKFKVLRES